jgi:hypothetical protein
MAPPPLPYYTNNHPLKFPPEYSYYTDGSFVPPKQQENGLWTQETSRYGIFNSIKNIEISKRLSGLQNILGVELTAIHHTLTLINTNYPAEPAYIFIDNLNSLFLLYTEIYKSTMHINHPDKVMLASIVSLMQNRTQLLFLHKVRAHFNIYGNDKADALAKASNGLSHRLPLSDYEHAHSTPYYLHKDWWHSMMQTPYKGPIRHLQAYIDKCDRKFNLETLANSFPNIRKWTIDKNIDKQTSTDFWEHPAITDFQISCLLKFRYNQYMGNARKQLYFGPVLYLSITCSICNSRQLTRTSQLYKSTHPHPSH